MHCRHSHCEMLSKYGFVERFYSKSKNKSGDLSLHEQKSEYHPCCQDGKRCEWYADKNKTLQDEPPKKRMRLKGGVGSNYDCPHGYCNRSFAQKRDLRNHQNKYHLCIEKAVDCEVCSTDTAESIESTETPTVNIRNLQALDYELSESNFVKEFRKISNNSIIINEDNNGNIYWGRTTTHLKILTKRCMNLCMELNMYNYDAANNVTWLRHLIDFVEKNSIIMDLLLDNNKSVVDIVNTLKENEDFITELFTMEEHPILINHLPLPSIDACLELKDSLSISDAGWKLVGEVFKLPAETKINSIRRYRKKISKKPNPCEGGYTYDIRDILRRAVKLENIPNSAEIQLKLSLDAGQAVKGSKKSVEAVLVDIISINDKYKPASACKSHKNSYLISIFQAPDGGKDPETNENLHKSTVDLKKFVQDCIIQEKMQIGDDVFLNIKLILCVDMKCLTEILGISAVYNHKTKYGCCWCNVIRKKGDGDTGPDINDFSKSTKWEFRDIKQMQEIFNTNLKTKSKSTRKSQNSKFCGQQNEPLFSIPLECIIPCLLHCSMSIVRSLHKLLLKYVEVEECQELLIKYLKEIKISVPNGKEGDSKLDRLSKIHFKRPVALKYLTEQEAYLKCLDPIKDTFGVRVKHIKLVFKQALYLLTIASSTDESIILPEEDWIMCAKIFASNFQAISSTNYATSYLHLFVYHLGYFLNEYGCLEKLSNFSIENTIHYIKKTILSSTSKFGGRSERENNTYSTVLEKNYREQESFKESLPEEENDRQWSCRIKSSLPYDIKKYFLENQINTIFD